MEDTSVRKHSHPCKKKVKVVVLWAVIALIWAVLALPTVFYHLPESADLKVEVSVFTDRPHNII